VFALVLVLVFTFVLAFVFVAVEVLLFVLVFAFVFVAVLVFTFVLALVLVFVAVLVLLLVFVLAFVLVFVLVFVPVDVVVVVLVFVFVLAFVLVFVFVLVFALVLVFVFVVVVAFVVVNEFCSQNSSPAVQSPVWSAWIGVKVLDKPKNKTIPKMPDKRFIVCDHTFTLLQQTKNSEHIPHQIGKTYPKCFLIENKIIIYLLRYYSVFVKLFHPCSFSPYFCLAFPTFRAQKSIT
jgi:hypothetical protein